MTYQSWIDELVGKKKLSQFYATTLEDLVGDCWLALLRYGPEGSLLEHQAKEIIAATKRSKLKEAKRIARNELPMLNYEMADDSSSEEETEEELKLKDINSDLLRRIVGSLPDEEREVIEIRFGLSYSADVPAVKPLSVLKTAKIMNISVRHCRTITTRALKAIKEAIQDARQN